MTQTKEEKAKYMKKYRNLTKEQKLFNRVLKELLRNRNKINSRYKSDYFYEWKKKGLISNNLEDIWERYRYSKKCELCNVEYTKKNKKCMDHNHNTGKFRNILCNRCNTNRDIQLSKNNITGIPNICFDNSRKKYIYRKTFYGKTITKRFETKQEAIDFKIHYEQNLKI